MRGCDAQPAGGARFDAAAFCAAPDTSFHHAVLGIFTIDEHERQRHHIRSTWLGSDSFVLGRFVLHGLGALAAVHNESRAQRDSIFLHAPAVMSCKAGPLRKLLLWLGLVEVVSAVGIDQMLRGSGREPGDYGATHHVATLCSHAT